MILANAASSGKTLRAVLTKQRIKIALWLTLGLALVVGAVALAAQMPSMWSSFHEYSKLEANVLSVKVDVPLTDERARDACATYQMGPTYSAVELMGINEGAWGYRYNLTCN